MLKELKAEYADSAERTQALLKEQQGIRKQLKAELKDGPKTVPEMAEATGMPADVVLWHLTAMKKYDLVVEAGQSGEYYQYELPKENK